MVEMMDYRLHNAILAAEDRFRPGQRREDRLRLQALKRRHAKRRGR